MPCPPPPPQGREQPLSSLGTSHRTHAPKAENGSVPNSLSYLAGVNSHWSAAVDIGAHTPCLSLSIATLFLERPLMLHSERRQRPAHIKTIGHTSNCVAQTGGGIVGSRSNGSRWRSRDSFIMRMRMRSTMASTRACRCTHVAQAAEPHGGKPPMPSSAGCGTDPRSPLPPRDAPEGRKRLKCRDRKST